MKVGVVTRIFGPDIGGGHVIQLAIIGGIRAIKTSHTFFLLDLGKGISCELGELPIVDLARFGETTEKELLESAIQELGLDVVWFLHPLAECVSVPFIMTVWDLQHRRQPYFPEVSVTGWSWPERERAYRATLPRASRILTGTQAGKNEILHFYGVHADNVKVIPIPAPHDITNQTTLDTAALRARFGLPEKFLLYPAQFWPHKNHINLLLALEELRAKYSLNIALVLTGSDQGNRSHVEEVIQKKQLTHQVHLLGLVCREDLIQLYRCATALIFPTFFGPDNIPPLEAFVLGCPVIASRLSGSEEQLGDAAQLFDPTKPQEIADAIAAVCGPGYRTVRLRNRLIKKGFKLALRRSSPDYVRNVCEILDEFEPVRRCWPTG